MKKVILISLSWLLFCTCSEKNTLEPENNYFEPVSITSDNLIQHVKILAGLETFSFDGEMIKIESRHKKNPGNDIAANYIESRLIEYGYEVENQWFSSTGRNVIAIKSGSIYPDKYYLFGAHYDDMPGGDTAPGADDNASGSAAVLEAARVFNDINTDYSVIFAFWDEEESGLVGSNYFAEHAIDSLAILLAFNADMIAYDHDNDNMMGLYNGSNDAVAIYIDKINSINNTYNFNIDLLVMNQTASSDDRSFDNYGFNSIGFVEIHFNSAYDEFNPYWHSIDDTIDKFNLSFYERMSKLIITSLADFSGGLD